jgi:GT2 family glycosyltransferase
MLPEISIIIVNYNVKYFLEQCLHSVYRANSIERAEVIVVDNASQDGSVEYISQRFPLVRIIHLEKNVGFSAANNLGVRSSTGSVLLFLNPDTIVPEHILTGSLDFLMDHVDAGAVGFRMIDGAGHFLKESKRGNPTIWASFCKFSGISGLFPSKKAFSGYYMGYLSESSPTPIDVICGAAFTIKREAYTTVGGFDERFFMYGEDVDISIVLKQAGFTNYYYPEVTLIHFKGESNLRNRQYFRHFYGSMATFLLKHAQNPIKRTFSVIFNGIWPLLAEFALFMQFFRKKRPKFIKFPAAHNIRYPGKGLTYRNLISDLEKSGPVYISAVGSTSIVGSDSGKYQGNAIYLENMTE